jgi:hypothetical protein
MSGTMIDPVLLEALDHVGVEDQFLDFHVFCQV